MVGIRVIAGRGRCRRCKAAVQVVALFDVAEDGSHSRFPGQICADKVVYLDGRVSVIHHRCGRPRPAWLRAFPETAGGEGTI